MEQWRGTAARVALIGMSLGLCACTTLSERSSWLPDNEAGLQSQPQAQAQAGSESQTTQADEPWPAAIQASLERLQSWQDYGAELGQRFDPQQANWEVEAVPLAGQRVELRLRMKRFHTGGAGEAGQAFNQRARALAFYGGYSGYRTLEYSEGIESLVGGARRVVSGVIELLGTPATQPGQATQGTGSDVKLAPATASSSPKALKPRS